MNFGKLVEKTPSIAVHVDSTGSARSAAGDILEAIGGIAHPWDRQPNKMQNLLAASVDNLKPEDFLDLREKMSTLAQSMKLFHHAHAYARR